MPALLRLSLLFLLCIASATTTAFAQTPAASVTVFGTVQAGETKAPLPLLTVQLRTAPDSAFVTGRLTNENGAFTFAGLRKGVYLLEVRTIGYAPLRQRVVVGELSAFLDLGTLFMVKDAQALSAVAITSTVDAV